MIVNVAPTDRATTTDAGVYYNARKTWGFNALWSNILCGTGTGGRADYSTYDGHHAVHRQQSAGSTGPDRAEGDVLGAHGRHRHARRPPTGFLFIINPCRDHQHPRRRRRQRRGQSARRTGRGSAPATPATRTSSGSTATTTMDWPAVRQRPDPHRGRHPVLDARAGSSRCSWTTSTATPARTPPGGRTSTTTPSTPTRRSMSRLLRAAYNRTGPARPHIFVEGSYEHEHNSGTPAGSAAGDPPPDVLDAHHWRDGHVLRRGSRALGSSGPRQRLGGLPRAARFSGRRARSGVRGPARRQIAWNYSRPRP
jgi:hypothetical protein